MTVLLYDLIKKNSKYFAEESISLKPSTGQIDIETEPLTHLSSEL